MSSISIDAAGQRGITTTMNDPARSFASMPTKAEDDVTVYVGNAGEVSVLFHPDAKVKFVRMPDGSEKIFVKSAFLTATAYSGQRMDPPTSNWIHASISARKGVEDYYAEAEVVREATLGELLGLQVEA